MVRKLWIAAFALAGALALGGCRDRDDAYGGSGRIEEQRSSDFRGTTDRSGVPPGQDTSGSQLPDQSSGTTGTSSETTPGTGGSGTATGEQVVPPAQPLPEQQPLDKDMPKDQQEEVGSEKQMNPEQRTP